MHEEFFKTPFSPSVDRTEKQKQNNTEIKLTKKGLSSLICG